MLQEKMRTTQKQLDDLTRQVSTLLSEKSQLETRTRILEQVVYLNTNHEQMLHANQACPHSCSLQHSQKWCMLAGCHPCTTVCYLVILFRVSCQVLINTVHALPRPVNCKDERCNADSCCAAVVQSDLTGERNGVNCTCVR